MTSSLDVPQETETNPYAPAAARGGEFLDVNLPRWAEKIDVGGLDMANAFRCVVGQLYRDDPRRKAGSWSPEQLPYYFGLKDLEIEDPVYLGFAGESDPVGWADWRPLTEAWKAEILKRRSPNG